MATKFLLPSAVDYLRVINDNTVDNLLAAQPSYAALPSLYQRAYAVVHQTGAVKLVDGFSAPEARPQEPSTRAMATRRG